MARKNYSDEFRIRASLAMPALDALDGVRAAMVAVVLAWVESA